MINVDAIKSVNPESLMVTWDVLRRCNLDCTYCESTRHDNYSSLPSIEVLKKTFDFIDKYAELYNSKRLHSSQTIINFTGGEPTINPAFWELIEYIRSSSNNYHLGLTTNGTWGPKFTDKVAKNFNSVTISWHAEADTDLKNRTIENILELNKRGVWVSANIMLHCDYFDEAKNVCEFLKQHGIKVRPRVIGDGNLLIKGWFIDADGTNRRTSHEYTTEQQQWYFDFLRQPNPFLKKEEGANLGRSCCGGRCIQGKINNEWQEVKLVNTSFKDWYCTVNWYFLHVDQHEGTVYHHQTCQATHTGKGPIGYLSDTESILEQVRKMLDGKVKPIICPNQRCGCGMCVSKAKDIADFEILWGETTTTLLDISK